MKPKSELSEYSLARLNKLEAEVIEELKKRHFLSISQAREQVLHIARGAGLSAEDLMLSNSPNKSKVGPAQMKYHHPIDATRQWSGRGRRPGWVRDWIASGKSLDTLKI
ncbi:H-NS histone family protein [Massilia litorea]|uniref:H-NS histone family protein n=1 Tax=Massilia litorea TaxID=2769491 RepID=A0A7L9UCS7_9BURK|nr:H-NS histone family protein [Massilia litorea]QOL52249.1 H-NS histone family protein [Massilia litorea]